MIILPRDPGSDIQRKLFQDFGNSLGTYMANENKKKEQLAAEQRAVENKLTTLGYSQKYEDVDSLSPEEQLDANDGLAGGKYIKYKNKIYERPKAKPGKVGTKIIEYTDSKGNYRKIMVPDDPTKYNASAEAIVKSGGTLLGTNANKTKQQNLQQAYTALLQKANKTPEEIEQLKTIEGLLKKDDKKPSVNDLEAGAIARVMAGKGSKRDNEIYNKKYGKDAADTNKKVIDTARKINIGRETKNDTADTVIIANDLMKNNPGLTPEGAAVKADKVITLMNDDDFKDAPWTWLSAAEKNSTGNIVKQLMMNGVSKSVIETKLRDNGWKDNHIKEIMRFIGADSVQSNTNVKQNTQKELPPISEFGKNLK